MNNKNITIIPPLSSFEHALGMQGRKIKAAVFIPNISNNPNLHSLELVLWRSRFLDIVDWYTDQKGYQRGSHRMKKIFDLYSKSELDMVICYSKEDLLEYERGLENNEKSIKECGIPAYCINDCILIKDSEHISLR